MPSNDNQLTIQTPPPDYTILHLQSDQVSISIKIDGTVEFTGTVDQAAQQFWKVVEVYAKDVYAQMLRDKGIT